MQLTSPEKGVRNLFRYLNLLASNFKGNHRECISFAFIAEKKVPDTFFTGAFFLQPRKAGGQKSA